MKTYNNVEVPQFMYGTAWKKEQTTRLVELAVGAGFRAIDTANQLKHYDEALVGEALQNLYQRGHKRDDLFLQTKFTHIDGQDHRLPYDAAAKPAEQVKQSVSSSLSHLHTDYLDSYLLHGPSARYTLRDWDWEVWGAIEDVHTSGQARAIGVSNFDAAQLRELCARARVKPMFVQNRCFAALGWDREVREICAANNIIYQGFSLLTANVRELNTRPVHAIAQRTGGTIAQVVFRFAMQVGMLPLTGTTDEHHMKEDLACTNFELTPEELHVIEHIAG